VLRLTGHVINYGLKSAVSKDTGRRIYCEA
jgi:hypothetical protein